MIPVTRTVANSEQIVSRIEERSGMRISNCYQCGRCTSTCIAATAFDIPPHRIMRLLQLGMTEKVLSSKTAQLCVDCMTCSMRCPMEIDVATVIETVKNLADEMGIESPEKPMRIFRQEFLKNVRRHGRLHEPSLMTWINLKTGHPFNDMSLIPSVLRKKKVHLVPPRIRNLRNLRNLFRQVNSVEAHGRSAVVDRPEPEQSHAAGEIRFGVAAAGEEA